MKILPALVLLALALSLGALEIPKSSKFDKRITYASYNADDVFLIKVRSGYVSMLKFSEDERIVNIASGFSNGWDLAEKDNFLFIKAKPYAVDAKEQQTMFDESGEAVEFEGASVIQPNPEDWKTNLIVTTTKRVYVFDLQLEEENSKTNVNYKVDFVYPSEIKREKEAVKEGLTNRLTSLKVGDIVDGVVTGVVDFGAFVNVDGIEGLVHISEIGWERVAQVSDKLKVGDKIKGKVVVLADYGAFIEVAPGVEGLVHISEMSWTQHVRSAQELLKVGDEVEAVILSLDREERKMSLGLKQLKEDPWENIDKRFPIGSRHTAKVRNFTNFGVFVEIEEGIDGLVHISDLSWTKKIKHPNEFTEVGAPLEIVVLEIDKENRRLSLGHKQLEENPWNAFEADYRVGTIHEGTIREFVEKGAVISLPEGIEAFATPKHLVKADGTQAVKGETLPFKVIEFNKDSPRIIVSHSRTFEDEAKAEARASERAERAERQARHQDAAAAVAATNAATEKATLGDLDALAALKEKLS